MVTILNRFILICKVCNTDVMSTWSHMYNHMDITECGM